MAKIDLTVYPDRLEHAVSRARERNIVVPTYKQMKNPASAPAKIKEQLGRTGLWDVAPSNLFRITWKNQPVPTGGGFGGVNYLEMPSSLTGTPARVIALVGKWFPTGAHKVGAAFGCLVPRLVPGQFGFGVADGLGEAADERIVFGSGLGDVLDLHLVLEGEQLGFGLV